MPQQTQQEKASMAWFASMIKGVRTSAKDRKRMGIESFSPAKDPFIGGMFFFVYDPKFKDKLPWWDSFPLVIPIDFDGEGFLGLNLHYLPPMARKPLIEKLIQYKKRGGTAKAYMKISYQFLRSVAKTLEFETCVHRYLFSNVRTQFVRVDDSVWMNAAMLPVQRFQGASSQKVWRNR